VATGAGGGGGGGVGVPAPAVRFTCCGLPCTAGGEVGGFEAGWLLTVKVTLPLQPGMDWMSTK
jgi:hypothetical protein